LGRFLFLLGSLMALLRQIILAHFQVINEGSPTPETAFAITDVELSQAFYGQLAPAAADYYSFEVAPETEVPFSMLIPTHHHEAGFLPTITLYGPGLPPTGLLFPAGDAGARKGTTSYQRTQQAAPTLAGGGYLVEVRGPTAGVYCFCIGTREPKAYADKATRERVKALLA